MRCSLAAAVTTPSGFGETHTRIALVSRSYQTHITPASHPHHTRTTLATISTRNLYCHTLPVCHWHATPPPFCYSSAAAATAAAAPPSPPATATTATTAATAATAATTTNSTSLNQPVPPVPHYSLFSKHTTAAATSTSTSFERISAKYEPGVIQFNCGF
jgi:hypothetical protein